MAEKATVAELLQAMSIATKRLIALQRESLRIQREGQKLATRLLELRLLADATQEHAIKTIDSFLATPEGKVVTGDPRYRDAVASCKKTLSQLSIRMGKA